MVRLLARLIVFAAALLMLAQLPLAAQDNFRDVIEMSVEVGFDSYFRPGEWTPIRIELKNNGESVTGRLVVRPETSGTVVGNAFSTPIDLPTGAAKSALLNIQARTFPDQIRVELIDDNGLVQAAREASLFDLAPQNQLYAVVTGPTTAPPNLSGVHIGGFRAEQAIWGAHEIPEHGPSLGSLDMMLLVNIDGESLSNGQRRALLHWVEGGGHLIVSGGPSALGAAGALSELLPLRPERTQSIDDLSALARYAAVNSSLSQRTVIAVGDAHEDAQTLVEQDGAPLLLRREIGAGIVDYLAADPTLEPLASWGTLDALWLKLLATRAPHPTWREGFTRPAWGADAIANLPGVDLLPPLQTLCLFLFSYIALIGPLNYFALSRLRRNGWGWFTIPVVIICFTGIAWTVGFSLRGAEIIVSRTTVLQSFTDRAEAQSEQFVGLLSPRRATYSLALPEGRFLAVAGATAPTSIFASNTIQTSTEISQGSVFGARDFTIDGGIFANFSVSGRIPKPAIGGAFTLSFDILESGRMSGAYQGVISNESAITLRDAVVLGPGFAHRLEGDFAPGDIVTLDREALRSDIADPPPQPNPLELNVTSHAQGLSPFSGSGRSMTIKDIQGGRYLRTRAFLRAESAAERQAAREQSFLASFAVDQFHSDARGVGLYLVGWSDQWTRDLEISGAGWSAIDTTLYVIELDVDIKLPSRETTLTSEYFSWLTLDRIGLTDNGTDNFSLYEEHGVEYLFHPLPGLALDEVSQLHVEVDRGGGYAQSLAVELYNWRADDYDIFDFRAGDELTFDEPGDYLGSGNAIRMRLRFGDNIGTARIRKIRVEQTGRYH
ncbi:MAG: hypothetical protein OXI77_01040 [Chloroflexota bacterium]|nr:hypothetical protein [Chloroflexota bacterium]MDE2907861.1 hypothetical protein [Chloroflexota bacterium]